MLHYTVGHLPVGGGGEHYRFVHLYHLALVNQGAQQLRVQRIVRGWRVWLRFQGPQVGGGLLLHGWSEGNPVARESQGLAILH